jgi:hypothetical protein
MTPLPTVAQTDDVDELHAELHHLTAVQRTALTLARVLSERLAGEPFRLAEQLVRLLDGELEPDGVRWKAGDR